MLKKIFPAILILLVFFKISAQEMTVQVVDSNTGEGLPQATIRINDTKTIITNASGMVYFPQKYAVEGTVLTVAYLGYRSVTLTMTQLQQNDLTIKLEPIAYQLQEVDVQRVTLTADTIMARVKKNLPANYKGNSRPLKSTVFYRKSTTFKPVQASAEMSKSSKLKKEDLQTVNADITQFTKQLLKHPPQETVSMAAVNFSAVKSVKEKPAYLTKFRVDKAVKYREDKMALHIDEVEKRGIALLMKHLDSAKAYRIKSGLFGTRDTVIAAKTKLKRTVKPNLSYARSQVMSPVWKAGLAYSPTLNFVARPELYSYTLEGTMPYGPDSYVYKITFKPRKRKARYAGTLYISPTDYAVLRADYGLEEGKVLSGMNLKLILGIKHSENISSGTLVFRENQGGEGYYLHYSSSESGEYTYINRPLKFIEITGGDKEKVAFDLMVELDMLSKEEYLSVSREKITEAEFDAIEEKEFSYETPEAYNPNHYNSYISEMERLKSAGQ